MKAIYLTWIPIISILIGCSKAEVPPISKDEVVLSIFTPDEASQLEGILSFFDSQICAIEGKPSKKFDEACYQSFFQRLQKTVKEKGDLAINIPAEAQTELFEKLGQPLKDEIWRFSHSTSQNRLETNPNLSFPDTIETLDVNSKGKYVKFIGKLSETDPRIKFYNDRFQQFGNIGPTLIADVVENHSEYNIHDEKIRLVLAIHYLTLNHGVYTHQQSKEKLLNNISAEIEKKSKD